MAESIGEYTELKPEDLHLDQLNPRLPEGVQGEAEDKLLRYIAETYNAIEIGRSIALHGYFRSEPLIVVEMDGKDVVVEGNRRLVAFRLLAEPELGSDLEDFDEWVTLADRAALPDVIPVIRVGGRKDVAPIIGYRHISGIEPWDPYAKARFIANLVDVEGLSFATVSDIVGEPAGAIAAFYRNQAIVEEAESELGVDVARVVDSFGVFTRAMNSPVLRDHIGVPGPGEINPKAHTIEADKQKGVAELFSWLFGDDKHSAVISDSRDITKLGEIVASDDALDVLRSSRDVELAHVAAGGIRSRLTRRLTNAYTNMIAAAEDLPSYADDEEVEELVTRCESGSEELRRVIDGSD